MIVRGHKILKCISVVLIVVGGFFNEVSAQSKMDTSLVYKTNWKQVDDSQTGLYSCNSCNLTINKDQTWGFLSNKNIKLGRWSMDKRSIVLHNEGTNRRFAVTITELNDSTLTIEYFDQEFATKVIALKPNK